jgi:ATP-independent RNA helicase DbpA
MQSDKVTFCIDGGKKSKLRAGDILGTLCKEIGLTQAQVGKITIGERQSYVAIERAVAKKAFDGLKKGKIKKRSFRVWWL